jgi:cystine transport system substrate-binding protein
VQSSGVVTVALRPDAPQVLSPGGTLAGFDIDVTNAIAARLGVAPQLDVQPVDEMLAQAGAWQLALPGQAVAKVDSASQATYQVTAPYYGWPVYLLVASQASGATRIADLAGGSVCVVPGTAGEAWARLESGVSAPTLVVIQQAPAGLIIRNQPTDAACLDDLRAGRVRAMLTSSLLESDMGTLSGVRALAGPVVLEPRQILVAGDSARSATMVAAVNDAIASLRADGTLGGLAKARFGGQDLSALVP